VVRKKSILIELGRKRAEDYSICSNMRSCSILRAHDYRVIAKSVLGGLHHEYRFEKLAARGLRSMRSISFGIFADDISSQKSFDGAFAGVL
jgi:hypothetical protein